MCSGASYTTAPADPHELAAAQPGDTIRLVPGSSAEPAIAVLPVAGPE
jgi:hypothetical protein